MKFPKTLAAAIGTALVAVGVLAGSAMASPTSVSPHVAVTSIGQTSVTFTAIKEDVQIYTVGTVLQVYRNKSTNAGSTTVSGLKPGTAYDIRATLGHGWTAADLFITTAASGAAGTPGSSGVLAVATKSFGPTSGVITGGGFVANSTAVGTAPLPAGTYEICLSGKVEQPTAATGSVMEQLFLYDQPKSSSFTGDLLNVSTNAQAGTTHDAYLNGCTLLTEKTAVTLYVYAFGYDSDNGAGAYNLMDATVSAVALNPAS